ncbi:hypothetical protein J7J13_00760 [bacterium]|nr:hypothetical protein [bacterium]
MRQEKMMPNSQDENEDAENNKDDVKEQNKNEAGKVEEENNEAGDLELADKIENEKEESVEEKRERLQKELDGATASYEKKRQEIEAIKKELGESVDLGESAKEEEIFKEDMEKAQSEINALKNNESNSAGKQESAEQEQIKEQQPLSEDTLLKELESMPENERKTMEIGWHNLGFAMEGTKAKIFSKITGMASKFIPKESAAGKFLEALSGTYKKDAELQERKMVNAESEEGEKILKTSNRLKLASNALKVASYIGHGPAMGVSSVFARGMETAKKMRLDSEEVLNKNRIADENAAAEEAWAIYEQAQKSSKEGKPSRIDLQRSYETNVPKDVLERLSKSGEQNAAQTFLFKIIRKPMEFSAKRLDKKIQAVENNQKMSAEEKEARKNKLLDTYSRALNDLDGIVSQAGEVDTIAAGLKYAEVAGKGVMAAIMAKTVYDGLEKIWDNIGGAFSSLEEGDVVEKGAGGFHKLSHEEWSNLSSEEKAEYNEQLNREIKRERVADHIKRSRKRALEIFSENLKTEKKVKEIASAMGIEDMDKWESTMIGGVPVKINGKLVPLELLTEKELRSVKAIAEMNLKFPEDPKDSLFIEEFGSLRESQKYFREKRELNESILERLRDMGYGVSEKKDEILKGVEKTGKVRMGADFEDDDF